LFQAFRITEPPKTGPLKVEYGHWFKIKDQMIRDHPHMQVGIVGRRVVAVEATHAAAYRQVLEVCGSTAMLIVRADDEEFFGDWDFESISRKAAIDFAKAIRTADEASRS